MRRILMSLGASLMLGQVHAQFNTPTIDGSISASEYGTHTSGQNQLTSGGITWFLTWDDTHLFIAASGYSNFNDAMNLYIDTDPTVPVNGGSNTNGNLSGPNFDGVTPNLPFRANFYAFLKNNFDTRRTSDGSGAWSTGADNTFTKNFNDAGDIAEVRIPWSVITGGSRPSSFNFLAYMSFSGGGGGLFAQVPTANPSGTSPNKVRYFTVSATADGSATKPFSRESYCHVGGSTTGFGSISVWDFTMNTASTTITRAAGAGGVWNIANDLVINQGTIDYGTSTNVVDVNGNVSLNASGTLTLSTAIGGDLRVAGNMTVNGTFNKNSRAIFFDGSAAQTVSATSPINLDFVFVENTGGVVTFEPALTVATTFEINPGCRVVLNNNMTLNGTLTVEATSESSYGQILPLGTISGTGNVVFQKAVTGTTAGWRFFSPSTSGTQNNLGTGLTFNQGGPANVINLSTGNPNGWQGVGGSTATALVPGRGYALYFGASGVNGSATTGTISTTGSVQTSNVTVSGLSEGNSGSSFGWTLVGNPFSAGLTFDHVANTRTNLDNAYYIWNPTANSGNGAYASFASGTSSPSGALNGIIPPGQGFLVKANAASPVLTFGISARTTNTPNSQLRTSNSITNRLYVRVTNTQNSFYDETAILSVQGASSNFESERDAFKLNSFNANAVNLSSLSGDGQRLSVNTLDEITVATEVPLSLQCTESSLMTLDVNVQELDPDLYVVLHDRYLNRNHSMRTGQYTFAHVPAEANRFVLRFAARATTTDVNQIVKSNYQMYVSGDKLFVRGPEGIFNITCTDMLGRQVFALNNKEAGEFLLPTFAPGTYVLRLQDAKGVQTLKINR